MKKVEIVENMVESEDIVKITEQGLLDKISEKGLSIALIEFDIPESFLLKWALEKEFSGKVIIDSKVLSENFIVEALSIGLIEKIDIYNLNMGTYANLSEVFIKLNSDNINWERMLLYLVSSDKMIDITKFEKYIEKYSLWNIISAENLPIDFIRKYKEKLDWRILSIIKDFDKEETMEFYNEIPKYLNKFQEEN